MIKLNKTYLKYLVHTLLLLAVAVILLGKCTYDRNIDKYKSQLNVSNDVITKYRDDLGREVSEKRVVLAGYNILKTLNAEKDDRIAKLQDVVNRKTETATIIRTETKIIEVIKTDTFVIDNNGYPVYKFTKKDKWVDIKGKAGVDSTQLNILVTNEYAITQEWKRRGLFKPKDLIVKVRNENPYTSTVELTSYKVKQKKQRKGLYILGALIAGFVAGNR